MKALIRFLVVRNLGLGEEEGNQEFLDPEEDRVGKKAGREVDEEYQEDVVDVRWVRCKAKGRGSTPGLVVAWWYLEVDDNCVTIESRLAADGGRCVVVEEDSDWIFRASNPRHRLLPCSSFNSKDNGRIRTSFVSIPERTWDRECTMT